MRTGDTGPLRQLQDALSELAQVDHRDDGKFAVVGHC